MGEANSHALVVVSSFVIFFKWYLYCIIIVKACAYISAFFVTLVGIYVLF